MALFEWLRRPACRDLLAALDSPDPKTRARAAWDLVRIRRPLPQVRDAFWNVLRHSTDVSLVSAALAWLGRHGERSELIQLLIFRMNDADPAVARTAIVHLGHYRHPSSLPELLAALPRHSDLRQSGILAAIGNFAAPVTLPAILPFLESGTPLLRAHAAIALGRIGDARAVPFLEPLLADHTLVFPGDHPGEPGETVAGLAHAAIRQCRQ